MMDATKFTHVIYAFATIDQNFQVTTQEWNDNTMYQWEPIVFINTCTGFEAHEKLKEVSWCYSFTKSWCANFCSHWWDQMVIVFDIVFEKKQILIYSLLTGNSDWQQGAGSLEVRCSQTSYSRIPHAKLLSTLLFHLQDQMDLMVLILVCWVLLSFLPSYSYRLPQVGWNLHFRLGISWNGQSRW